MQGSSFARFAKFIFCSVIKYFLGLAKNPKSAGRGATISAVFALEKSDEIRIIVGQKGSVYSGKDYFGGSGGTFVVKYRVS